MNIRLGIISIIIGVLPAAMATHADDTASGYVYHDQNEDGIRDQNEPGVPGVLVSNGTEVVKTGEEGKYELPVDNDTILFVIKPRGWMVRVNDKNIPQSYYIHKPEGSPDLKYPGVEPTGPLPDSIDFPLTKKKKETDSFSMLTFGDPQPYSKKQVDYFSRDIVSELVDTDKAEFGVILGDIVGNKLNLFEPMTEAVAKINIPFWYVYGNHDMNFDVEDGSHADESFERVFGPATYAFNYGDVYFIVLDNVLYPQEYTDSSYTGGFTEEQFTFLENLLKHVPEDALIVPMMHIPIYRGYVDRDNFGNEMYSRFSQLFSDHPRVLSLSAHTHIQEHIFYKAGELGWLHEDRDHHHYNVGTTSGSWWFGPLDDRGIPEATMQDGTPNGYAIIHFEGNEYTIDWKSANKDPEKQMNLFAPKVVRHGSWSSHSLLFVNFFNGNERTQAEFRIEDGDWKEMRQFETMDPQYTAERYEWDRLSDPPPGLPLPYPRESSHIWIGRLPNMKDPGTYLIEVRVTDMFGRTFRENTSYRVEKE